MPEIFGDLTEGLPVEGDELINFYVPLDMKDKKIINVQTPTSAKDAANKEYVDTNFRGGATGAIGATGFIGSTGPSNIPQNSQTSAYVLAASDTAKHISITTGGVTLSSGIFNIGDVVTIYNNSTSNQIITSSGVTLRLAGTSNTGNRTLAQYGIATILCVASNTFVISGAGIS